VVEVEIPLRDGIDPLGLAPALEAECLAAGLAVTHRGTLARYPGSRHWHLKRGRERGTLEVTLWPEGRRLWLSVQDGRRGDWIEGAMADLVERLASAGPPIG
jgi:hypothetical protein